MKTTKLIAILLIEIAFFLSEFTPAHANQLTLLFTGDTQGAILPFLK